MLKWVFKTCQCLKDLTAFESFEKYRIMNVEVGF